MNTAAILLSPPVVAAVVGLLTAITTGVFIQRRLIVMVNLARYGMKQGNMRTKFNAIIGTFETQTPDPETIVSKEKPPPKGLPTAKPERTAGKQGGEDDIPARACTCRTD